VKWDTYPSHEHEAEDQLARTHAIEYAGTLIFDLNRLVKRLRKTDDYQPDAQDAGNLETNLAQLRVNMAILETLRKVRKWDASKPDGTSLWE
jgi:hypothetical protein